MQLPPGDKDAAEVSKTCSEGDPEFTSIDPSSSSPSRPESRQVTIYFISNSLFTSCHYDSPRPSFSTSSCSRSDDDDDDDDDEDVVAEERCTDENILIPALNTKQKDTEE